MREVVRGGRFGVRGVLLGLMVLIALTAVVGSLTSLFFLSAQEKDAPVINIAGRQRMLSQKMTKEALMLASAQASEEARQQLSKTSELFETSHRALIQGNRELGLPETKDKTILARMMVVDGLWRGFKNDIQTLLTAPVGADNFRAALSQVLAQNVVLLKEMNSAVELYEVAARQKVGFLRGILVAGIVFSLTALVLSYFVLTSRVIGPIRRISGMVQELGRGDLAARVNLNHGDELGRMAAIMDDFADNLQNEIVTAFHRLAEGDFTFKAQGLIRQPLAEANQALNRLMAEIKDASGRIASGAGQIADTSTALSQGATEQAASLEQITASIADMERQVTHNARNADQANQLADLTRTTAEDGNRQMGDMVRAMTEINEASQSISKIIKTIDEIAFQTNLLALNAAVEAARAGQHGKGFAVVAEEVRNLAARSAKAAQETASLIEGSVRKVDAGSQIADRTAAALNAIVENVSRVNTLVGEIAVASKDQASGISEINLGLQQIDQVTHHNTSNAEQSAASSEDLNAQAVALRRMLARFHLATEREEGLFLLE